MTERAMPEGELRTLIQRAIEGVLIAANTRNAIPLAEMAAKHAVEDLAVLRPHLGPGATERERAVIQRFLDVTRTEVSFEIVNAVKPTLRAIAGRGEAGTAEGA